MRKHQRTTATMEGDDSPAATPRNSTESSKTSISIWAKFDSASIVTPADVMARKTNSVQLEFDHQYVAQAPISRSSCPIRWWAQHKPSYPILSSVAQTMLCVPSTSIFSKVADLSRAGAVKSRHCHFFDGQSVTVASLLGRWDSDVRVM